MRIALVTGRFPVLSETFVLNQITGLLDRGHEVEVFAEAPDEVPTSHPDVRRYRLVERTHYWPELSKRGALRVGKSALRHLTHPRTLARSLRRAAPGVLGGLRDREGLEALPNVLVTALQGDFDVVYCHFGHIGLQAARLQALGALRGKLVTVFHGYDMTVFPLERGRRVYDPLFERAELLLPISEFWRERLIDMGAPPEKIRVHRMGIDPDHFTFEPRRPDPDGVVRVVSVARLVEKKGIEYGISAVARVAADHPGKIEYHIIGDGPLREKLERLVDVTRLEDAVVFHGWKDQDQIVRLLEKMHVMMVPSVTAANGDMEGLPVVLMEAMARGLPVVTTRHSGIPELVEDDVSGFLVPERDVAALADRLLRLVEAPQRWEEMGRAGRAEVERDFDIHELNDRLEAILAEVAARG